MPRRLIALALALAAAGVLAAGVATSFGAAHRTVTIGKNNDFAFSPAHLRVAKGARVRFVWASSNHQPHNVHIYKAPRGVKHVTKGGRRGKIHGVPVGITFRKVGTYKLMCTIHPFMKVTVRVHR